MKVKESLDCLNSKPIDFDILIELVDITNGNRESLEIEIVYNDCYEREIYLVAKI